MDTSLDSFHVFQTENQQQDSFESIVQVTNVNSQFKLSSSKDFFCDLDSLISNPVGKICILQGDKVIVRFSGLHGKGEIYSDGKVKCYAQLGFKEAMLFAKRIVWEISHFCKQPVDLLEHQFVVVQVRTELPWKVHLVKMKKFNSAVQFEPEINCFAVVRYAELGASVHIYGNGKVVMWCTGDCQTGDRRMPRALEALARVGHFASAYSLVDSLKQVPTSVVKGFIPKHLLKTTATTRRRSDRLVFAGLPADSSEQSSPSSITAPDWILPVKEHLSDSEARILRLLQTVAVHHNQKEMIRILTGAAATLVANHPVDGPLSIKSLQKVATLFKVKDILKPLESFSEPIIHVPHHVEIKEPEKGKLIVVFKLGKTKKIPTVDMPESLPMDQANQSLSVTPEIDMPDELPLEPEPPFSFASTKWSNKTAVDAMARAIDKLPLYGNDGAVQMYNIINSQILNANILDSRL